MTTITLLVRTTAEDLGIALGVVPLLPEVEHTVPELEGTVVLKQSPKRKGFSGAEIMEIALTFSAGVASGVVANWLYDRLRGKGVQTLTIDRVEVLFERGKLMKFIEEHRSRRG